MSREKRINEEVLKTLECLDTIETIEATPYFYSRLEDKLSRVSNEGVRRPRIFDLFSRPLLRPAFVALLMLINLVSAAVFFLGTDKEPVARSKYIAAVAQEYSLTPQDSYSYFPDSTR